MIESSLSERKSSLANSCLYHNLVELLSFLQRTVSDDRQTDMPGGRSATAKAVYDTLSCEISQLVMGKLETGDDVVVSRVGVLMLCIAGKSSVKGERSIAEKAVRFVTDDGDVVIASAAAVASEEDLSVENEKTQSLLAGDDVHGGNNSPMWALICDTCWLSLSHARSQLSCRHLRFLADLLCFSASDQLLIDLLTRAELPLTNDASSCRNFLEQVMLPLVDKFDDDEGSRHVLSVLTSLYARLQPDEQVLVAREIARGAARNLICANFLSGIVSCKQLGEELRCWLHGSEFGKFVVELTGNLCQRRLIAVIQTDEAADMSMVIDRSMDDSHWKLLCACLAINEKSGLSFLAVLVVFLLINYD